jgi:hypothetical protein
LIDTNKRQMTTKRPVAILATGRFDFLSKWGMAAQSTYIQRLTSQTKKSG